MNSTTGNSPVRLRTVILFSLALQAAGLAVFYSVDALRKSHLNAETEDVRQMTREAEKRLQELEAQKDKQRERTTLKEDDARKMTEKVEREKAGQIIQKLHEMKAIRETLREAAEATTDDVRQRTAEDFNLHFYYQVQPLSTQLVNFAGIQQQESSLPPAPLVLEDAETFHATVEKEKTRLLEPETLASLEESMHSLRDNQRQLTLQLDDAQRTYTNDTKRIHRENYNEYNVNRARETIARLLDLAQPLDLAAMNAIPADAMPGELPPGWEQNLEALSVPELHAEAEAIFGGIQELFSTTRAADMAVTEHTSFQAASQSIDVPRPATTFQSGALPNPPTTVGELSAYASGLNAAAQDVNRLWQSAFNMAQAGRAMAGISTPQTGQQGQAAQAGQAGNGEARRNSAAANRAATGQLGRYADMTPFMYQTGDEGGHTGGIGGGGSDVNYKSKLTGYQESGTGARGPKSAPFLSEDKVLKEALPGRKFSRTSKRTGWLYIDTWYVIGPWENKGRLNLEQTFPPETLVDLDAEYTGKKGTPLSWKFHQSDNIRIKPPDEREQTTYYGYTEVYFEEQTEMLIAVASDDVAKVWLNGLVIWQDSGLSSWRLDEGFRNVVFKKGFNTILLRVDNGPITCTFSILLCPPDAIAMQ